MNEKALKCRESCRAEMSLSSAIMTHTGRNKYKMSHSFLMTLNQKWAELLDLNGVEMGQMLLSVKKTFPWETSLLHQTLI